MAQRTFGFLNATRQYLRFLASQAVGQPNYGVLLTWDNFIRGLSPRPTSASMIQPRNLTAYYPNDVTALRLDGSNNVILWEDRSGNSAVNCLRTSRVAGNTASLVTGTNIGTGDVTCSVTFRVPLVVETSGVMFLSDSSTNNRARAFFCELRDTGHIHFVLIGATTLDARTLQVASFFTGRAGNVVTVTWTRTGATLAAYVTENGVTTTLSGSEATTGTPPAWSDTITSTNTYLGTNTAGGTENLTGAIFRGAVYTAVLNAASIIADAAGTMQASNIVFINFALATKLAASFTATSGQTVTITSTGATGARVSGERDLYQGTAASRPAYTAASGGNRLFVTFDGTDDYLKSAAFSLSQPESVYFVGSQVTWTVNRYLFDGGANDSMGIYQDTSSPNIRQFITGAGAALTTFAVGNTGVLFSAFNGASSSLRLNRNAAGTGSPGATAANGFTIGSRGAGGSPSNITVREVAIYSAAHGTTTQNAIIGYLSSKFGISL